MENKRKPAARRGAKTSTRRGTVLFSDVVRDACTKLWLAIGEDPIKRAIRWKQLDVLYPAHCEVLYSPEVDLEENKVFVEALYLGVGLAEDERPVIGFDGSDDEPGWIFISAPDKATWLAKRAGKVKGKGPAGLPETYVPKLQAIADRFFGGCFSHELSDIVDAHSPGNGCCYSADRKAERRNAQ